MRELGGGSAGRGALADRGRGRSRCPGRRCSPGHHVARPSLLTARCPLSDAGFPADRGPIRAPTQGAARRSPSFLTAGRCAAALGARG